MRAARPGKFQVKRFDETLTQRRPQAATQQWRRRITMAAAVMAVVLIPTAHSIPRARRSRIRGSASHVYEKYLQLARDANSSGDRVMAENYLQHAEHYFRIMVAQQAQQAQYQAQQAAQNPNRQPGDQPAGQQPQAADGSMRRLFRWRKAGRMRKRAKTPRLPSLDLRIAFFSARKPLVAAKTFCQSACAKEIAWGP